MDERIQSILAGVDPGDIAKVAAGVVDARIARVESTAFAEISAHHADLRTIGIVRAQGTAVTVAGSRLNWSSVAKLVDLSVAGQFNNATSPENEALIYERGLFAGTGLSFRPARCYHISRPGPDLRVLWLEDLTTATAPPFGLDQLARMVRDMGEWNAATAAHPPPIDFPVKRDFPKRRWDHWNFPERAIGLRTMEDTPLVRAMYGNQPLSLAAEFVSVLGDLVDYSTSLPHALAFSDAPLGNFFHRPHETIAVDWSGLGLEALGADGGCFIGSGITWGHGFADVAAAERDLYDAYAAGLADGGAADDAKALRTAYVAHLAFYLGTATIFPTMFSGPLALLSREYLENRYGMPLDELGDKLARVVDLLPRYVAEARDLLAGAN